MKSVKYCFLLFAFAIPLIAQSQVGHTENTNTPDATVQEKVDSIMHIANAYYMLGQVTISIEFYDKAITLNPNFAKAFFNRGNSYFELGVNAKACDDWQKAKLLGHKEADMSFWKFCE